MPDTIKTDICVIGAGSGGLTVAAGASQMGADTVLIERGRMGGDCLNYGCVPSKAMLAAAHAAHAARHGGAFGVSASDVSVDFGRVNDHIHEVIAAIAPNDSVERFEGLGVRVIRADARFTGDRTLQAGDVTVSARRVVIATGSSPMTPPIPGLDQVAYFTNETIFDNRTLPEHLLVIGGGPIGLELAQAHRRLGARVTVLEAAQALGKDDPDLAAVVLARLREEGVVIHDKVKIERVNGGEGIKITLSGDGVPESVEGSHLLVATGRKANVDGLDLEKAGVNYSPKGIAVDDRLRTSNHKIFAIGDVTGGYQFTHMASYHAGIAIRNALFRLPSKVSHRAVPWVTYTDPELAQVGLTEAGARQRHSDIQVLRWTFEENDRAHAERAGEGVCKVMVTRRGEILGATLVGRHAGELLQPWIVAVSQKLKIGALANIIAPYPTLAEVNKRAAGSYYTPKLFNDTVRKVVRLLAKLG
ncbi:MAG: FAD-dependent oxidoreductase [Pseudomonadota bacterium]|nr:FAD-dependent oxidoreductase [Pseudomonadota bacterium]